MRVLWRGRRPWLPQQTRVLMLLPTFFLEVTCALAWCLDAIANALGVTPLQELGLGTAPQLLSTSASLYHSGSQSGVSLRHSSGLQP